MKKILLLSIIIALVLSVPMVTTVQAKTQAEHPCVIARYVEGIGWVYQWICPVPKYNRTRK